MTKATLCRAELVAEAVPESAPEWVRLKNDFLWYKVVGRNGKDYFLEWAAHDRPPQAPIGEKVLIPEGTYFGRIAAFQDIKRSAVKPHNYNQRIAVVLDSYPEQLCYAWIAAYPYVLSMIRAAEQWYLTQRIQIKVRHTKVDDVIYNHLDILWPKVIGIEESLP